MLQPETTKLTIICPRCDKEAGTVEAKLSTEYSSEYDDEAGADKGSVKIEVVFKSKLSTKPWEHASSIKYLDHTCDTSA